MASVGSSFIPPQLATLCCFKAGFNLLELPLFCRFQDGLLGSLFVGDRLRRAEDYLTHFKDKTAGRGEDFQENGKIIVEVHAGSDCDFARNCCNKQRELRTLEFAVSHPFARKNAKGWGTALDLHQTARDLEALQGCA
jgi:hypothetical protein